MRHWLVATFIAALASGVSSAQETPDVSPGVLDDVYACAEVSEPDQRLACYDSAVGRLRQAESAGEFVAVDSDKARAVEREAFGFNVPSLPKLFGIGGADKDDLELGAEEKERREALSQPLDNLEFPIRRIATRPDGKNKRFYLENGQVWAQTDGKRLRLAGDGPFVAHIRRAALDSFLMQINGQGAAVRVKREE